MKNVLLDCEESQATTIEMRKKGHNAYSCDLLPCSGGHPEWHIQEDALKVLRGGQFVTQSGELIYIPKWDLVIAHPPCTRLANSGVRWLASTNPRPGYIWDNGYNVHLRQDPGIWIDFHKAVHFFNEFVKYGLAGNAIAIENPIQHRFAREFIPAPTQTIQPWQHGHGEQKATCLWVYNLPQLKPSNIVSGRNQNIWLMPPGPDRAKLRSKTYPGIAKAFADQFGEFIKNK